MDIKILTRLGLMLMSADTREERLSKLVEGNVINGPAVAALINEARDACYVLTEKESESVDEYQKIQIRWMLTKIDGEKVVRNMDPDELGAWVLDLRENKTIFSISDLGTIAGALMKRE